MSAEDERRAMQMAAKHATAGAGANEGATRGAPKPARLSQRSRGSAAVPTPTPLEKEKPRGVLPALWLLDPTRKTLVWSALPGVSIQTDSLWPPSSSPVSLSGIRVPRNRPRRRPRALVSRCPACRVMAHPPLTASSPLGAPRPLSPLSRSWASSVSCG
ncbi:hypothetical protein FB451DRAFT_1267112, partial [Mycena latifolia]